MQSFGVENKLPSTSQIERGRLPMSGRFSDKPLACVLAGMDLLRPLGLAGIRCAVVTQPGSASLYSRFTRAALRLGELNEEEFVDALLRFGSSQRAPPVLFYVEDSHTLLISRYRERLAQAFRFAIAEPTLIEDLVDKGRFQLLAERLELPVPPTRRLHPVAGSTPPRLDLGFPLIIKPLTRQKEWDAIGNSSKALRVDTPEALQQLWPSFVAGRKDIVAQQLIPGPETRIESYHVYVDQKGSIAGEFTGRKIRTYPPSYGYSTALEITDAPDVMALGRSVVEKTELRGVAKFDLKRDERGALHLLEINPRFNLWHHPGTLAGVNLPALVYADLVGLPRPPVQRARAGVRWCLIWRDWRAARACRMPVLQWLLWVFSCEAKSAVAWDDPMPVLGALWFRGTRALREFAGRWQFQIWARS
jgi:D-aspartate ligase